MYYDATMLMRYFRIARKFHELTQAYELLLDPLRRLALDAKLRLKQARTERYKAYDSKRKNLLDELEERERAFKKAKVDKQKEEAVRHQENERIMEEGKKLREQRAQELKRKQAEAEATASAAQDEEEPPALDPLDTTVRVKFAIKAHPELTEPSAIASLLSQFGPSDSDLIVVSVRGSKKASAGAEDKKAKYGTALVPFKQIGDAFAAVCASGRQDRGLDGVEVSWVGGKEPQILGWLKKMGKLGGGSNDRKPQEQAPQQPALFPPSNASPAASLPGLDYESLTLMRMRQAEREKLEREIRQREEAEH
ncbi:hypothetical protein AX14_012867 [Amanita brunnescens Koide BX004]|nr:hypothetical protein AX14_012867 [Amanita brunnescens Koide BX004]